MDEEWKSRTVTGRRKKHADIEGTMGGTWKDRVKQREQKKRTKKKQKNKESERREGKKDRDIWIWSEADDWQGFSTLETWDTPTSAHSMTTPAGPGRSTNYSPVTRTQTEPLTALYLTSGAASPVTAPSPLCFLCAGFVHKQREKNKIK